MTKTGLAIVALTALLVSLSSIFSRFAYDVGANPQTLILLRFSLFCVLYLLIKAKTQQPFSLDKNKRLVAMVTGCVFTIGSGSLLASMYFLPVSLAVVIFYTYPIITMLGEKILDRKPLDIIEASCFLLAFVGLLLALKIDLNYLNPIGIALGITASLGVATSYLISERKLKGTPPQQSTFYLAATGMVLMMMFVLFTRSFNTGEISTSNLCFVLLASFSFAIAFFFMFKGISMIGAVNTAMILNLEPVFTIALAFFFLKESLSITQLTGVGLVLMAIFAIQHHQTLKVSSK